MGLKSVLSGKVEQFAIGFFIRNVESGRYGEKPKAIWLAIKGKKTIVGWALFAIGGAVTAFPDPSVIAFGQGLAVLGSYLGRFGIIAKGSDRNPPMAFPEEYRSLAQSSLSACTYIVELLSGLGGLLMLADSDVTRNISFYALIGAQGLSTTTGYLATLIGPTPKQAATAAVVQAVAAVEADVAAAVEIAGEVAAQTNKDAGA